MSRPPPKRSRPGRWLAAALVLLPVLGVVAWVTARLHVADLADQLVIDVTALEGKRVPRPTHVDSPLPGTFADHCGSALDDLRPSWKEAEALPQEDGVFLRSVIAGDADLEFLPDAYWLLLLRDRDRFAQVRRATHAEDGTLPGGMQIIPDPASPLQADGFTLLRYAADAGLIELRVALASGEPEEAVEHCLDVLALGRDAAGRHFLLGRMIAAWIANRALPGCTAALDAAPARAKRSGLRRLAGIRDAAPAMVEMLRDERISWQLWTFGPVMPPSALARLSPRARAMAADAENDVRPAVRSDVDRLLLRDYWSTSIEHWAQAEQFLQLEERVDRAAASRRLEARRAGELNPMAGPAKAGWTWLDFDDRHRAAQLRLDAALLLAAADLQRAEQGRWPATLAEAEEALHREGVERDRRGEGQLTLELHGDDLSIIVPLTPVGESEGVTTLLMHADAEAGSRLEGLGAGEE